MGESASANTNGENVSPILKKPEGNTISLILVRGTLAVA